MRDAGAEDEHPVTSFSPHVRIAETCDSETRGRSGDHGLVEFFPGAQSVVLRNREALRFKPGVGSVTQRGFLVRCRRSDAGVNQGGDAIVEDSTAAENAVPIGTSGSR